MASSFLSRGERKVEAFISYGGKKLVRTFVGRTFVGRLYLALILAGVDPYIDSFRIGDATIPSIKNSFQDTRIAIIIFSEDYASSLQCLDELAMIMECKKQGSLVVYPVFYRVLPWEVRLQTGRFGEALGNHEDNLGKDSNKLKRWRDALFEAGGLTGLTLDADGDDVGLVTSIIKKIVDLLDRTHLYASSMRKGRYDVFLSFRGPGSRHTIINQVYRALCQKGVYTFKDSEELEAGQRRSELFDAIKASRIAVVTFSENYAGSKWCLDELAMIMECKKQGSLVVYPVFDWVLPWEVRLQTGRFGEALGNHEDNLGKDSNKLKRWRDALFEAGCLTGLTLDADGDEAGLVTSIVKKIFDLLDRRPLIASFMQMAFSSLSRGEGNFNVFISYWGPHVRNTFVGRLCDALVLAGIHFYHYSEALRSGDWIISHIKKSIQDTRIAIIIISEGYACSHWCLDELAMIMECKKQGSLVVFPVYDRVRPGELRLQRGIFGEALAEHEDRLGKDSNKLKRWRDALSEVDDLLGLTLDLDGDEAGLVTSIIKKIFDLSDRTHLYASSTRRGRYDVFLSFRGSDSRHTIISHLYVALCQKSVYTFKDSEELEKGQKRSELFDAIMASRIAVVMFSENYAGSKWCLDELKNIMELREMNQLIVVPIFYRVSPREVRLHEKENGEKGCYQVAMKNMEAKYSQDNSKMVESWKKALWKGGDLTGFSIGQGDDEGSVIRSVVEWVMKVLNRVTLEIAENPVGMTSQLERVKPLLLMDPHADDVCMIGIVGHGGVGKTTLSKAILTEHFCKFDDWCFLPNIREESKVPNGLALLQQKLLRKLLGKEDLVVGSVDEGKVLIKKRLRDRKVLVILDDIDEDDQFGALAGNTDWFGDQSRIIITTRNRHVLPSYHVQQVHEVSLLNMDEAEELFRWHALHGKDENMEIDQLLVDRFLKYADRLPLALVVLGKSLRDRSASEWESSLKMLDNNPNTGINAVLKTSFDGLGKEERQIFLDISCFFKAWDRKYVVKILDSCGFATTIGVKALIERFLITDEGDKFQMHDLIEEMGKNIVRDERSEDAGSRIWLYDDFVTILSIEPVTNAVKGIVVLNWETVPWDEKFNGSTFKDLYRLRILIVRNGFGIEGSLHLPRELRWLEWPGLSVSTILFSDPRKLVALDLTGSNVERIMGKAFKQLKYLNLSKCESLNTFPDLSHNLDLEDLNLSGCKKLTKIHDQIGSLKKLVHLNLGECNNLAEVPSSLGSSALQTLNFSGCSKLVKFPVIERQLQFLHELSIEKTAVKELPNSIGNLVAVKILNLSLCTELTIIPRSIYKLQALEKLLAIGCSKLEMFPRSGARDATEVLPNLVLLDLEYCNLKEMDFLIDLTCFKSLKELRLSSNGFPSIPDCISRFDNLKELWLCSCKHLVELPELPNNVKLYIAGCCKLRTLRSYHTVIHQSPRRRFIDLSNCHYLNLHSIGSSLSLKVIREFGRSVEALVPGKAFPQWMIFQITEHNLKYEVLHPEGMSEDDILGLALSVTFNIMVLARSDFSAEVKFMVGECEDILISDTNPWEYVHTWFIYLPRQSFANDINWSNITFRFVTRGVTLESFGLRVVCKEEGDDDRFKVQRKEEEVETDWESD